MTCAASDKIAPSSPAHGWHGCLAQQRTAVSERGTGAPPVARRGGFGRRRARRHGATSTEYILILGLVVLPLGLLLPMFLRMIVTYATRITSLVGLPFP